MDAARDPERYFSDSQRQELFNLAGGKCEKCKDELRDGEWAAHHKLAWELGGRTTIDNGEALCVPCHKEVHREDVDRSAKNFTNFHKTYDWQDVRPGNNALDTFLDNLNLYYSSEKGQVPQAYVMEVSPSGGKTIASCKIFRAGLERGLWDRGIFVVPASSIKNGFADDIKWAGEISEKHRTKLSGKYMRFDTEAELTTLGILRNHHGIVITYQALRNRLMLDRLRMIANTHRLMFVFDEAHHGASGHDTAGNVWGQSMAECREMAHAVVAMTGTPVRADDKRVPFLEYEEGRAVNDRGEECDVLRVKPSFKYSYTQAVRDGVARRSLVISINPIVSYTATVNGVMEVIDARLTDIPASHLTASVKNTVFEDLDGCLEDMVARVDRSIRSMRENGDVDAACLVIVRRNDKTGVNQLDVVADRIKSMTGDRVVAVETDGTDAPRAEIKRFKTSSEKWIVAKDMISEGTNLPRIRIVLILRDIGNQTFYQQLVHRATRNDADDRPEDAVIYQARLPDMVKWGRELEEESSFIWIDPPREPPVPGPGGGDPIDRPEFEGISADLDGTEDDQVNIGKGDFTDTDPIANWLFEKFGLSTFTTRTQNNLILRHLKDGGVDISALKTDDDDDDDGVDPEEIRSLREETTTYAKRAAGLVSSDISYKERLQRLIWPRIKKRAGVTIQLKKIEGAHENPLEAFKALRNAAREVYEDELRRHRSPK